MLLGQGSLTPPGAPAGTMRTLDQLDAKLEPRVPISSGTTFISQPGSYYLTTNVSIGVASGNGILISVPDVTIDLNGFTLAGTAANTGEGIGLPAAGNVTIRNGTITGWGNEGINGSSAPRCVIEDVLVFGNGRSGSHDGIGVGNDARIVRCTVVSNTSIGIVTGMRSEVIQCIASTNGGPGIQVGEQSVVKDCVAANNAASGFVLGPGANAENCIAVSNLNTTTGFSGFVVGNGGRVVGCVANYNAVGISTGLACKVIDSTAVSNKFGGIILAADSSAIDCVATQNGSQGISTTGDGALVSGCSSSDNAQDGIFVNSFNCMIVGNLVTGNNAAGTGTFGGIRILDAGNRVERNHIGYPANFGVIVTGVTATNNVIICNTTFGNTNNVHNSIPAGNDVGPWSKAATATSPFANIFN